jgi:hypothetical protein
MEKQSKPWFRGAISLAILVGVAAALITSPAISLTSQDKKQVKKIAKKVATKEINKVLPDLQERVRWALINAGGTEILAQSGGISITGQTTGRVGVRFAGSNANEGALSAQVTAFGFAGTGAQVLATKIGPCTASTDCALVGGSATTDAVVGVFQPNGDLTNAGLYVTLTS